METEDSYIQTKREKGNPIGIQLSYFELTRNLLELKVRNSYHYLVIRIYEAV